MTITRTTPLADLPELLRPDEVCAWTGLGKGTVYELARRGELPACRLGRLLFISRAGLAALVTRNGHGGGGA